MRRRSSYREASRLRVLALTVLLAGWSGHSGADETGRPHAQPVTLFLIGDSTVKNGGGRGDAGQWGWGQVLQQHFDSQRLTVENRARGGRSSRTYLTEGLWQDTLDAMSPGDFLLIQFGHNDGGQKFRGNRPRASIKGNGEQTEQGVVEATGKTETVHSYGWYLRKFIADAKAKGAAPIVLSPVPRDVWEEGRVRRATNDYGKWAREAAQQAGAYFIDLNQLVADRYEQDGQLAVHNQYFTSADHTHTSRAGAEINAECVAHGIRTLEDCKLRHYLLPAGDARLGFDFGPDGPDEGFLQVDAARPSGPGAAYHFADAANLTFTSGTNFDCVTSDREVRFSVQAAEGNHRVRITLGRPDVAVRARLECELRRRMTDEIIVPAGQTVSCDLMVNTRTPVLPHGGRVRLKAREKEQEAAAWDCYLDLRVVGENPGLARVEVLPAPGVPTLYVLGDSTVSDQPLPPWAGWAQMLPRYFGDKLAIANHAESGETIAGAWNAGRCDKVLQLMQDGDWLFVQFGHNDMKSKAADALEQYQERLRKLVRRARDRGGRPVLVTSMERVAGVRQPTLGDYPDAVRQLAGEEGVPLIDLNRRSVQVYRALGDRLSTAFQDPTHHNEYGAELLAAAAVDGIRRQTPDLAELLTGAAPVRP